MPFIKKDFLPLTFHTISLIATVLAFKIWAVFMPLTAVWRFREKYSKPVIDRPFKETTQVLERATEGGEVTASSLSHELPRSGL